jgi:hypothetical protein
MRDTILPWRPRTAPANAPASDSTLWSMHKGTSQIECRIRDQGRHGWRLVFLINGEWYFSCQFEAWTLAIAAADDKHAELERSGWSANGTAEKQARPT